MTEQTELQALSGEVVAIHDEVEAGQVAAIIDKMDAYKRRIKEIDATLKEALIDWINANGELTLGTKRYYVGSTKKTKPVDRIKLTIALIEAVQGDFDSFDEMLSANAFKPGACKKLLGDEWGNHFEETIVEDVKTGKPKKDVKVIDERFVK